MQYSAAQGISRVHGDPLHKVLMGVLLLFIFLSWAPRLFTVGEIPVSAVLIPLAVFILALVFFRTNFRVVMPIAQDARILAVLVIVSLLLICLALLSVLHAPDAFQTSRVSYAYFSGLIVLALFVVACDSPDRFGRVFALMAIMGLFTSVIATLSNHLGFLDFMIFRETGRSAGLFKHPNQLGMVISSTAPIVVAWVYLRYGVMGAVATGLILFAGSVYSGSKTNLVLVAVAVAPVFFTISTGVRNRLFRALSILFFITFSFMVIPLGISFVEFVSPRAHRLLFSFTSGNIDDIASLMSRMDIWAESVELGMKYPLFGVGAGQPIGVWPHSHNVILDYFRTLGFLGLFLILIQILCVIFFVAIAAFQARRLSSQKRLVIVALCSSIVIFILSNQTSESFGPNTFPFYWLFLGMLFSFRRVSLQGVGRVG